MNTRHHRSSSGNLAIICACFVTILILIGLFILDHIRFIGSNQEQVKAIEAAALAAAQDLSRIVYEDDDLGFISLSDYGPTGKATIAGDNFFLPVISINTHLATVRLDMIIAEALNDNIMRQYAQRDYNRVMAAKDKFVAELKRAVQPNQTAVDFEGTQINVYDDAFVAYNANVVRMTGGQTNLVPGSLRIELGCMDGLVTNVSIPQPTQFAQMQSAQQENQCYKAYVNIPFKNRDFVFAGTGNSHSLVDAKNFADSLPNLPYSIPCIIKCEADHQFITKDPFGQPARRVVHAVACARPGCAMVEPPTPGAILLSFPNGSIPDFTDLYLIMSNSQINKSPTDWTRTPLTNDHTPGALSVTKLPLMNTTNQPMGQTLRVGLYDWIRRGRSYLNVQSLLDAFRKPLSSDATPHADFLRIMQNGYVEMDKLALNPALPLPVSHKQWQAVSGLAFHSVNQSRYDIFAKDYVFQCGRKLGGLHAGEPLGDQGPPPGGGGAVPRSIDDDPNLITSFPKGPPGGDVRPTWDKQGVAVEIRFRKR